MPQNGSGGNEIGCGVGDEYKDGGTESRYTLKKSEGIRQANTKSNRGQITRTICERGESMIKGSMDEEQHALRLTFRSYRG